MNTALKADFLTVADYLEGEETSEVRHEFIDGVAYAMAGASREHNRLAFNFAKLLDAHLTGRRCQVSISDLRLHLELGENDSFYYPDVMVTCDPRDTDPAANRFPKVIVEVLSDSTDRIDRVEKFHNYTRIDTLEEYILVAQSKTEVTIFRRADGWQPNLLQSNEEIVRINSLNFSVPVREIYQGVRA